MQHLSPKIPVLIGRGTWSHPLFFLAPTSRRPAPSFSVATLAKHLPTAMSSAREKGGWRSLQVLDRKRCLHRHLAFGIFVFLHGG